LNYVIDASTLLAVYLPEEPCRPQALELLDAYTQGQIELCAPALMFYEIQHALLRAARAERLALDDAFEALEHISALQIPLRAPQENLIKLAWQYGGSAYDAAYLQVAQQEDSLLVTGDKRLFDALKEESIIYLGDWQRS
jgi:predicted nucleic acid-binding protein